ncbi:hypothetical protein [Nocardia sp. NPDC024068]|uniref:hypothetical protein n=1 Tax=Nocardia sp. NPDC024068 TaxID=3157197 RepID=UPI003404CA06
MNGEGRPVLYAIVTGATAARDVGKLVDLARADGWDVCVVASPELPVVAVPFSNQAQFAFPPIQDAVRKLSGWGVTVLDEAHKQHEPGTGEKLIERFPWGTAWAALLEHPWLSVPDQAPPRPVL